MGEINQRFESISESPPPGATTILRKRHSKGTRGEIGWETVGNRKKVDEMMTGRYRDESSMGGYRERLLFSF